MKKEYFILNLNHSNSSIFGKLENIVYKGRRENYKAEEYDGFDEIYEPIEVLAIKQNDIYTDVITGEEIVWSKDGKVNGLSFDEAIPASDKDCLRITKKYKKMTNEDILRYSNAIKKTKEISIALFTREEQMKTSELKEVSNTLLHYYV